MLRAGKALSHRRKMAILQFRSARNRANELRNGVDGPQDLTLQLTGGAPEAPVPVALSAMPPASGLPAYSRVLLDILQGSNSLSVSRDEAEESWRIVTPILDAWAGAAVPLGEHQAGSSP